MQCRQADSAGSAALASQSRQGRQSMQGRATQGRQGSRQAGQPGRRAGQGSATLVDEVAGSIDKLRLTDCNRDTDTKKVVRN